MGSIRETVQKFFVALKREKKLDENNIADALQEVRSSLLEADVSYKVVVTFIQRVREKALGTLGLKGVDPGDQFIQIVHEELVQLMGDENGKTFSFSQPLTVFLLCGLQGSGKTTSSVKLAHYLQKKEPSRKFLVVGCDTQRPAALDQLAQLATQGGIEKFVVPGEKSSLQVARWAREKALKEGFDGLILDTAGRLHLDEELMGELLSLKEELAPQETFFVANGATGQEAVRIAEAFHEKISLSGAIFTMLDGSARAGAVLSVREVTGVPLCFEGTGERLSDFRLFHPRSMADRILGMGDVIHLVEKAQEHFGAEKEKELEEKIRTASFTYGDYLKQMEKMAKMGSFKSLLQMVPGLSSLAQIDLKEEELVKVKAMILSMTPREREQKDDLSIERRKRIARGSGITLDDLNRHVKRFKQVKEFAKTHMPNLERLGQKGMMGSLKELQKLGKGKLWR